MQTRSGRVFSLGFCLSLLVSCGGGNNVPPECGNGIVEEGEECDSTADCEADCTLRPPPPACPRLAELPRLCVPLPGTGLAVTEVDPGEDCGTGFFSTQDVDVRKLFDDTILMKETGDASGERPVMVLFLGEGKALLFDTGNRSIETRDVIVPLLAGRTVEVLNTHLHGDHIGRNELFDVIAIETPEVLQHCGNPSFDQNQAAVCNNTDLYLPPGEQVLFANRAFRVVRVVRDGHRIDLGGGRQIEVLFTPGHAVTSVVLLDPTHRLMFTGDTLYPGDDPPLVHPPGSNFADYLATAERMAALEEEIDIVIGAHGEGVMPRRVLSAFLQIVQDHAAGGTQNAVNDAEGCPSGNFSFANFPP